MKKNKKISIVIVLIFMCIVFKVSVNAAQESKLKSDVKGVIQGDEVLLKVQDAGKKAKWRVSNKKILKIKKVYGKNNKSVKLLAKKKGKAIVTAKVGKKKYSFVIYVEPEDTIQVYKGTKIKTALVSIKNKKNYKAIRIKVCNGTKKRITVLRNYELQKKIDGKWQEIVPPYDENAIADEMQLSKNTNEAHSIILTNRYYLNQLTSGTYRIKIKINNKNKYIKFCL